MKKKDFDKLMLTKGAYYHIKTQDTWHIARYQTTIDGIDHFLLTGNMLMWGIEHVKEILPDEILRPTE